MAIIIKKCPYCKNLLPESMATIGIGVPFRECDKCTKTFIDSEVMEWDNASYWWKIKLLFGSIYGVWFYGVGCTVVPVAILGYLLSFKISNDVIFVMMGVGLLGSSLLYLANTPAQIRESKLRTSDPIYRDKLTRAGFKFRK